MGQRLVKKAEILNAVAFCDFKDHIVRLQPDFFQYAPSFSRGKIWVYQGLGVGIQVELLRGIQWTAVGQGFVAADFLPLKEGA